MRKIFNLLFKLQRENRYFEVYTIFLKNIIKYINKLKFYICFFRAPIALLHATLFT